MARHFYFIIYIYNIYNINIYFKIIKYESMEYSSLYGFYFNMIKLINEIESIKNAATYIGQNN